MLMVSSGKENPECEKKILLLCILLDLTVIGLIPLNLMLFNLPEAISLVCALLVIAATALLFIKGHFRKRVRVLVCILAVFTIAVSVLGSYCLPYWNSIMFRRNTDYYSKPYNQLLGSDEAKEDLAYAMRYLRKLHPALYKDIPKSVSLQYEAVKEELEQCEQISVNELSRRIESIFSQLRDAHTLVRANDHDRHIMKYYRQWIDAGYRITAVNGISLEQLLEDNSAYYSFESIEWQYEWLLDDIVTIAGLDYLGLDIEKGIQYTLRAENGQIHTESCFLEDFLSWDEYAAFNHIDDTGTASDSFVRYEIDAQNSLAILYLDACNYNDEYINCVREMFEVVKEMKLRHVAVDLRNNGGGNDLVISEFFRYLDMDRYKIVSMSWRLGFMYPTLGDGIAVNNKYQDMLFEGNLYLLTSAGTFSSAMMFAGYVKDNELGLIIGEAPGNNPNGYGEIAAFKLPNSELFMQISTKRFYRADKSCKDELVIPDIECNREEAMEELYRCIRGN